jgi:hypothetical protein
MPQMGAESDLAKLTDDELNAQFAQWASDYKNEPSDLHFALLWPSMRR